MSLLFKAGWLLPCGSLSPNPGFLVLMLRTLLRSLGPTTSIGLRDEFSKVIGYKSNTQKLITFLYTNSEHIENETKNTIAFTSAPNEIK